MPVTDCFVAGGRSADEKYCMFMRHRYNGSLERLLEHIRHESYQIKESALMKFASMEGKFPLHDLDWSEHYSFPRKLIQTYLLPLIL
ncbi:nucleolar complex protein 4 homolog [Salmo trutta]|uniref:nucleolar complex protein 4 homolog n=1 Tax=Salmo trutta TaxID=8032 RepID=UPI00113091E8|nr:nucleolar complex protein 4 homolog [Salmo trutta]